MGAMSRLSILFAAAETAANRCNERVSSISKLMSGYHGGRTEYINALRVVIAEQEIFVIGTFSLFEARLQHKFPDGPFFKTLKSYLIKSGEVELAERLWHYYLAVNVLKHGVGSSYEALQKAENLPFNVKKPGEFFYEEGDIDEPEGLIDIRNKDFVSDLINVLSKVYVVLGD